MLPGETSSNSNGHGPTSRNNNFKNDEGSESFNCIIKLLFHTYSDLPVSRIVFDTLLE